MRKITEMQAEIISLKQQVSDLKKENKKLNHLISASSKEISSEEEEEEYYTADEGSDNMFNHYCNTCKRSFKYPYLLKRHMQMKGKCKK